MSKAAAEVGLVPAELQSRIERNPRLKALGFGQLLVANGRIKRDAWEDYFPDLVEDLGLGGKPVIPRAGRETASRRGLAQPFPTPARPQARRRSGFDTLDPEEIFRDARSVSVRSRSRWFKVRTLVRPLTKSLEFSQLGMVIVGDAQAADLNILLDRPLFTYDFIYTVTHRKTGTIVDSGKVGGGNGKVAGRRVARIIIKKLTAARGEPVEGSSGPP